MRILTHGSKDGAETLLIPKIETRGLPEVSAKHRCDAIELMVVRRIIGGCNHNHSARFEAQRLHLP